jgi:hypothetical protein
LQQAGLPPAHCKEFLAFTGMAQNASLVRSATAWVAIHRLGEIGRPDESTDPRSLTRKRIEEWLLAKRVRDSFRSRHDDDATAAVEAALAVVMSGWSRAFLPDATDSAAKTAQRLFSDPTVRVYLLVNEHEEVWWFSQERYDRMLQALAVAAVAEWATEDPVGAEGMSHILDLAHQLQEAASQAGYRLEETVALLSS